MSQAKRARFCCQGTSVRLSRSWTAAMSGSLGIWPISPAAKPANPAPSVARSSRFAAGTSFALGRPYMSTNCAKKNSTPRPLVIFLTSSSLGSVARAMPSSLSVAARLYHHAQSRWEVRYLHKIPCETVALEHLAAEPHQLHGDLDHQPVVAPQVDPAEIGDASQALTERVR